jgi:hypothetical protein
VKNENIKEFKGNIMDYKRNSGLGNEEYRNDGDGNDGDWNFGSWNRGNGNVGFGNYGDHNVGNKNSGDCNSGDCNHGNWNKGNYNEGHFNTKCNICFKVFNKPCSFEVWDAADIPDWMYFNLTEWIGIADMSEQEQLDHPSCKINYGYLKVYGYQDAARLAWDDADIEDKLRIYKLPNFNAKVAQDIFGIDFDAYLESKNKRI